MWKKIVIHNWKFALFSGVVFPLYIYIFYSWLDCWVIGTLTNHYKYSATADLTYNAVQFISKITECTVTHQMHGCNIWHKWKFATRRCSNGSFAHTASIDVCTTTTHRDLYHHVLNRFMRVALPLKCQSDVVITFPWEKVMTTQKPYLGSLIQKFIYYYTF